MSGEGTVYVEKLHQSFERSHRRAADLAAVSKRHREIVHPLPCLILLEASRYIRY